MPFETLLPVKSENNSTNYLHSKKTTSLRAEAVLYCHSQIITSLCLNFFVALCTQLKMVQLSEHWHFKDFIICMQRDIFVQGCVLGAPCPFLVLKWNDKAWDSRQEYYSETPSNIYMKLKSFTHTQLKTCQWNAVKYGKLYSHKQLHQLHKITLKIHWILELISDKWMNAFISQRSPDSSSHQLACTPIS